MVIPSPIPPTFAPTEILGTVSSFLDHFLCDAHRKFSFPPQNVEPGASGTKEERLRFPLHKAHRSLYMALKSLAIRLRIAAVAYLLPLTRSWSELEFTLWKTVVLWNL